MKIAAYQMESVPGDVDANLAKIETAARAAEAKGVSILIAPELALTGYGAGRAVREKAETSEGAQVARLADIAAETGVVLGTRRRDAAQQRRLCRRRGCADDLSQMQSLWAL
jgi:5-aminopentanamidase